MRATKAEAEKDEVVVPTTLQEYCVTAKPKPQDYNTDADFYDDEYMENDDDEEVDDEDNVCDDGEGDSGHGDSWSAVCLQRVTDSLSSSVTGVKKL